MNFESFNISGPVLVKPKIFGDDRGYFVEAYKRDAFNEAIGSKVEFLQDNQSLSAKMGTVRGLHYQSPPHAQGKLVRCLSGRIIDVAVDARVGSPTYGQHVSVELDAIAQHQLWVPPGFLHGFSTLTDNVTVMYKVTDVYAPDCDGGVNFADPKLGIDWGFDVTTATLSDKDITAPLFADWNSPFTYTG
jgi:dTDP-4-dehydrorhamnose 3,5-epimerase